MELFWSKLLTISIKVESTSTTVSAERGYPEVCSSSEICVVHELHANSF